MICIVCGSNDFAVHSGVYFCSECSTQVEATQEEQTEAEGFSRRSLLSTPATQRKSKDKRKFYVPWTTTEAYNIILCKQVSALMKLGASVQLKNTVLYIWSLYLQKCEVAFRIDYNSKENMPRLGPFPRRRDMKVLYGNKIANIKRRFYKGKRIKRRIKSGASKASSHVEKASKSDSTSTSSCASVSDESENNLNIVFSSSAKKLQRKVGKRTLKQTREKTRDNCVLHMTLSKTLCFCYLGLLYCQDQLLLSDVLRFANEERIPYICATNCLPPSMKLQCGDVSYLTTYQVPDMWKISSMCVKIMNFLNLPKFKYRSILPIVCRYVKDLNLPDDLISVVKKLVNKSKKSDNVWCEVKKLGQSCFSIPVYEIQALAYIIVALKVMFVLDGSFEKEHSEIITKINILQKDAKFFRWDEWKEQASLKEYLFMNDKTICSNLRFIDLLSADSIISKYPYKRLKPASNSDYSTAQSLASKNAIKNMLSDIVTIAESNISDPSSFPLRTLVKNFMEDWRNLPMYKETKEIDFSILSKDFSTCSLSFCSPKKCDDSDELINLLISSIYISTEIISVGYTSSSCQKLIRSSSKYWFMNFVRAFTSHKCSLLDRLPNSFKWLLNFLSKYIRVKSADLYSEVVNVEKILFVHKKRIKM